MTAFLGGVLAGALVVGAAVYGHFVAKHAGPGDWD